MAPSETSDVLAKNLPEMIGQLSPRGQAQAMDTGSTQSTPGSFLKAKL